MKEWQIKALEYREQGLSSRKICDKLGWSRTKKSTINYFFERHDREQQAVDALLNKKTNHLVDNEYIEILVNKGLASLKKKPTILVIADTQCKSEESLDYMLWIGNYIANKKPDIIVHIGDHYDFPSLSSYDKGKASHEGKRLSKDIEAGNIGFEYLNKFISDVPDYKPRKVFCLGNHEHRLDRYVEDNPELIGTLGVDKLPFSKYGWEVHPFLKPVEINGIFFVHYLSNPFNGKPYGGNATNILKTVGRSFVVGHKQCLDISIRPTIDGKQQIGIVNGACYEHQEGYKGYQGNNHFRGLTVLHEVEDGFGVPMFVSLDYMKSSYLGVNSVELR